MNNTPSIDIFDAYLLRLPPFSEKQIVSHTIILILYKIEAYIYLTYREIFSFSLLHFLVFLLFLASWILYDWA